MMQQQRLFAAFVAGVVGLLCLGSPCDAQSHYLHYQSASWTSSNVSHTNVVDIQIRCVDGVFTSRWTSLDIDDTAMALTKDQTYVGSNLVYFVFNSAFTVLSSSTVQCSTRLQVDGELHTGGACTLDTTQLRNDLTTVQCCSTTFDDGLSVKTCAVVRRSSGTACANDEECSLGSCRGGVCCSALGMVDGCIACASGSGDGNCAECSAPYFLHESSSRRRRGISSKNKEMLERRRRAAAVVDMVTTDMPSTFPPQVTDNYENADNGQDLDVDNLVSGTCYLDQVGGSTCNNNFECGSQGCLTGYCCNATLLTSSCTACDASGACTECLFGAAVVNGTCLLLGTEGVRCNNGTDCVSGDCRGGRCCGEKGQSTGCEACDVDGECAECGPGYLSVLFECVADQDGSRTSSSSGSLSTTAIIGIGLGCGLALIIILVVIQRVRIARLEKA